MSEGDICRARPMTTHDTYPHERLTEKAHPVSVGTSALWPIPTCLHTAHAHVQTALRLQSI